jgi:uncharacterized membrane protein
MNRWEGVKNSFIAGLVLITPLLITLYILDILVGVVLNYINPIVQEGNLTDYTQNVEVIAQIIAVVLIVSTITFLGFLAQRRSGQRLFGTLGRTVTIIPIVRTIYTTVRQLSTSFSSSDSSYDSLVLVEFPREGIYAIGLSTTESPEQISDVIGEQARNVFLPSSPNPAGGRLVFVPESQIYDVDLSVGEGLGLIMTTGANRSSEDLPEIEGIDPDELQRSLDPQAGEQIEAETAEAAEDEAAETDEAADDREGRE